MVEFIDGIGKTCFVLCGESHQDHSCYQNRPVMYTHGGSYRNCRWWISAGNTRAQAACPSSLLRNVDFLGNPEAGSLGALAEMAGVVSKEITGDRRDGRDSGASAANTVGAWEPGAAERPVTRKRARWLHSPTT